MGIIASELKEWLSTIPDDHVIAIDESGALLVDINETKDDVSFEVGGIPLDERHYPWMDTVPEDEQAQYFGPEQECESCAGLSGNHRVWCPYIKRKEREGSLA